MFDEEPDGDPHGECAAEIYRLKDDLSLTFAQLSEAQAELQSIRTRLSALVEACEKMRNPEFSYTGRLMYVETETLRNLHSALKAVKS